LQNVLETSKYERLYLAITLSLLAEGSLLYAGAYSVFNMTVNTVGRYGINLGSNVSKPLNISFISSS